jgi:predicted lysophospholipase L1 biosynthesis ABC-type transport system permease subunit
MSANEVVLAPRSASALHVRRDDTVRLTGNTGPPVALVVSGIGFVPEGPHNTYADGGWVTAAGYNRLFTGFDYHEVLVTLRPGLDPSATADKLVKDVTTALPEAQGFAFDSPIEPTQVAEIRQVRILPIVLGFFLALLAIGAVGHALATAVRRRRQDLAVLRALGMTRQQCRLVTQATVLAVVGLIVGVPLGLALGRSVWRVVADYTPLQYAAPLALWTLVLIAPAALLLSNLLAAWPGHRAARLRIANVLRSE